MARKGFLTHLLHYFPHVDIENYVCDLIESCKDECLTYVSQNYKAYMPYLHEDSSVELYEKWAEFSPKAVKGMTLFQRPLLTEVIRVGNLHLFECILSNRSEIGSLTEEYIREILLTEIYLRRRWDFLDITIKATVTPIAVWGLNEAHRKYVLSFDEEEMYNIFEVLSRYQPEYQILQYFFEFELRNRDTYLESLNRWIAKRKQTS